MDSDSRIPIDKKLLLTIKEAAAYSNIGINRIDAMLREEGCPFVLYVGVGNWLSEKNLRNIFPAASSFDGHGMPCRRCVAGHFCTLQLRKIPFIY